MPRGPELREEAKGSQIGPPSQALIPESRGQETDPLPAKGLGTWMPFEVLRMLPEEEVAPPDAGLRPVPVSDAVVEAVDEPDSWDGSNRIVLDQSEHPIDIANGRESPIELGRDRSLERDLAKLRGHAVEDRPVDPPVEMSVPPGCPVGSSAPADRDGGRGQTFESDLESVGRELIIVVEEHGVPTSRFTKPRVACPRLTEIRRKPHHASAWIRDRRDRSWAGIVDDDAFEIGDPLLKN